jgi:uncharacterized protein YbjT (DUF2867 family)
MKVLIIGASGLLAGPVIRKMDEAGFELRLFSRNVHPGMFVNEYEIVNGDVFQPGDLARAMEGCEAVHISISVDQEDQAVQQILEAAKAAGIRLVSMVSGATVSEENRWFSFTDRKFRAEQMVMHSGIPYLIFRPTWFFESLERMVRNGKAMVPGKQVHPYHWVAADDFAARVVRAFRDEKYYNGTYYVYGPETFTMKELMEKYCSVCFPEIKKVSETPLPVLRFIAWISRNKQLSFATKLFGYFTKVPEPEITDEQRYLLGEPELDFDAWVTAKKPER